MSATIGQLIAVINAWTLASFGCYWCCKHYFAIGSDEHTVSFHVILLSSLQTLGCIAATRLHVTGHASGGNKLQPSTPSHTTHHPTLQHQQHGTSWGISNPLHQRAVLSVALYHFFALLTTNFSLALLDASSTMTLKFMEPIITALVLRLFFGKTLSTRTWYALIVVVVGSVGFTGNPLHDIATLEGTLTVLLSNFLFALRNIAAKDLMQAGDVELRLRSVRDLISLCLPATIVFAFVNLIRHDIFALDGTHSAIFAIAAVILHVTYSYFSVCYALKKLSVVSHAIASILTRVVLVLLLIAAGSSHNLTLINFCFLGVAISGLVMYSSEEGASKSKEHTDDELTSVDVPATKAQLVEL